jgi:hypothetical protein
MAKARKKRLPRGLSLLKRLERDMYWSLSHEPAHVFAIRIAFYSGADDMYRVLKHKKVRDA